MKKKMRRFTPDERSSYKSMIDKHLEMQKMTEQQRRAWIRKPYCYGGMK